MNKGKRLLLDFALERFRLSEASTDRIYTKAAALGSFAIVIGASATALVSLNAIEYLFDRVDVFLYYLFSSLVYAMLIYCWLQLFGAVYPKSRYKNIAYIDRYVNRYNRCETDPEVDSFADELLKNLGEAEKANRILDENRMCRFKKAVLSLILSGIGLGISAGLHLILNLGELI